MRKNLNLYLGLHLGIKVDVDVDVGVDAVVCGCVGDGGVLAWAGRIGGLASGEYS